MTERLQVLVGRYGRHIGTLLYAIEESPLGAAIFAFWIVFDWVLINWFVVVLILREKGWYLDTLQIFASSLVICVIQVVIYLLVEAVFSHWIKPTVEIYQKTMTQTERKEKD